MVFHRWRCSRLRWYWHLLAWMHSKSEFECWQSPAVMTFSAWRRDRGYQGVFGVCCVDESLFLSGGCFEPCVAGPVSCFNVPDGVDSDVVVDGSAVEFCGAGDGFVVWGGVPAAPAGRVTTVPLRGGKYKAPFCPQPMTKVRGSTAAKHNSNRFIHPPGGGRARRATHERHDR